MCRGYSKREMTIKTNFFGKNYKPKDVIFLHQVHSNLVEVIDSEEKIYDKNNRPKKDAIVTNLKNITIGIVTADCAPILFFDEEKEIIGAAHAGWKGAKSGIVENTIKEMQKLGAKNIKAKIGPMIHQESYEIGPEFYDEFIKEDQLNAKFFVKSKSVGLSLVPQDIHEFGMLGGREQAPPIMDVKYLFNLPKYVEEKLKKIEFEPSKIDTYQDETRYFSYRRSTHKKEPDMGRNISIIVIN